MVVIALEVLKSLKKKIIVGSCVFQNLRHSHSISEKYYNTRRQAITTTAKILEKLILLRNHSLKRTK